MPRFTFEFGPSSQLKKIKIPSNIDINEMPRIGILAYLCKTSSYNYLSKKRLNFFLGSAKLVVFLKQQMISVLPAAILFKSIVIIPIKKVIKKKKLHPTFKPAVTLVSQNVLTS